MLFYIQNISNVVATHHTIHQNTQFSSISDIFRCFQFGCFVFVDVLAVIVGFVIVAVVVVALFYFYLAHPKRCCVDRNRERESKCLISERKFYVIWCWWRNSNKVWVELCWNESELELVSAAHKTPYILYTISTHQIQNKQSVEMQKKITCKRRRFNETDYFVLMLDEKLWCWQRRSKIYEFFIRLL